MKNIIANKTNPSLPVEYQTKTIGKEATNPIDQTNNNSKKLMLTLAGLAALGAGGVYIYKHPEVIDKLKNIHPVNKTKEIKKLQQEKDKIIETVTNMPHGEERLQAMKKGREEIAEIVNKLKELSK